MLKSNYRVNDSISLEVLSKDQCSAVLSAAREILATRGLKIKNSQALEIFQKAGCYDSNVKKEKLPGYIRGGGERGNMLKRQIYLNQRFWL